MSERRSAVEAVDWSSLTDSQGPATRIPLLLSAVWSPDEQTRRAAYHELVGRLVSQGHPEEASVAAAPFLIDVVADPRAPDRFAACQVLRCIAVGDEAGWLVDAVDLSEWRRETARIAGSTVQELLAERARWAAQAPDEQLRRKREVANRGYTEEQAEWHRRGVVWEVAAYDGVRAGVPVYVSALDSPHAAVRLYAAHLLAWFPEEAAVVAPALARLLAREPEPLIAGTACVAAGLCGAGGDDALTEALIEAVSAWRDSADPVAHCGAVLGLARLVTVPDRALVEELYACLFDADTQEPHWPFLHGDMSALAARIIVGLDPAVAPDRVEVLIGWATNDVPLDAFVFVQAVLDAAFGGQQIPDGAVFADLRPEQQQAVRALLECGALDQGAMVSMLVQRHNLPGDPNDLRRWCV